MGTRSGRGEVQGMRRSLVLNSKVLDGETEVQRSQDTAQQEESLGCGRSVPSTVLCFGL